MRKSKNKSFIPEVEGTPRWLFTNSEEVMKELSAYGADLEVARLRLALAQIMVWADVNGFQWVFRVAQSALDQAGKTKKG